MFSIHPKSWYVTSKHHFFTLIHQASNWSNIQPKRLPITTRYDNNLGSMCCCCWQDHVCSSWCPSLGRDLCCDASSPIVLLFLALIWRLLWDTTPPTRSAYFLSNIPSSWPANRILEQRSYLYIYKVHYILNANIKLMTCQIGNEFINI